MTTEEKLCMVDDKTNALAHLYSPRIETLTAQIDEQIFFEGTYVIKSQFAIFITKLLINFVKTIKRK